MTAINLENDIGLPYLSVSFVLQVHQHLVLMLTINTDN